MFCKPRQRVQIAKKWISYFWKMVEHEIAESPKILWSANFLDPFTTYNTVSAPYLLYSLPYSQLKSGSQVLGGEILDTEIEFSQHWGSVKSSYWHQWTSHTSYQLKLSLAENHERWTTKSCRSNSVNKIKFFWWLNNWKSNFWKYLLIIWKISGNFSNL